MMINHGIDVEMTQIHHVICRMEELYISIIQFIYLYIYIVDNSYIIIDSENFPM